MSKITEYSGDLRWVDGGPYAPLVIRSLQILKPGRYIAVSFCSRADQKMDDGGPYEGFQHATVQPVESYDGRNTMEETFRLRNGLPIYQTGWFSPYRSQSSRFEIVLEWAIQELRNKNGERFCYVEVCWIDREANISECSGLLKGKQADLTKWNTPPDGTDVWTDSEGEKPHGKNECDDR